MMLSGSQRPPRRRRRRLPPIPFAATIGLIVIVGLVGPLLGSLAIPPPPLGAAIGAIPGILFAVLQALQGHRDMALLKERTRPKTRLERRVEDDERRRRDLAAEYASRTGRSGGRIL